MGSNLALGTLAGLDERTLVAAACLGTLLSLCPPAIRLQQTEAYFSNENQIMSHLFQSC